MTRALAVIPDDPIGVLLALRTALAGGDAILPLGNSSAAVGGPVTRMPATGVTAVVPQRVALVVQTSGSTGAPKRVALSADALLASAAASESALGGPGQWLLALPAHYIAGINVLVRSLTAGIDPVVLNASHFDPRAFIEAADSMDNPVRFTSLVPAQLAALLNEDAALETLRRFDRILIGGQATPVSLLAQAVESGLNVTRTYGSSETSGGCVYDGVAIGSTRVRIVDGHVELGGPTLAEGYLAESSRKVVSSARGSLDGDFFDDERTSAAFFSDEAGRWFRTSDTGHLTDGVLTITGRLDDVIVSGGIKVSLAAVERVVRSLQGLAEAVVVSRADARWGEVPVVVSTASAALDEVRDVVGRALGPEARPVEVVLVDVIPLTASGKPDRQLLGRRVRGHQRHGDGVVETTEPKPR